MSQLKKSYQEVLKQLNLCNLLKKFEPYVVGTPPLGIAIADSDIDIICTYQASDIGQLQDILNSFQCFGGWKYQTWQQQGFEVVICRFRTMDWDIEIFCSTQPMIQQFAYRHFHVEQRLLHFANAQFKEKVLKLKQDGIKTEPAFASILKLQGDGYQVLSELFDADDRTLLSLLANNNYLKSNI